MSDGTPGHVERIESAAVHLGRVVDGTMAVLSRLERQLERTTESMTALSGSVVRIEERVRSLDSDCRQIKVEVDSTCKRLQELEKDRAQRAGVRMGVAAVGGAGTALGLERLLKVLLG